MILLDLKQNSLSRVLTLILCWSRLKLFLYVVDVDECTASSSVCHVNATCNNTLGSYQCTCKPGYAWDGKTCRGKTTRFSSIWEWNIFDKEEGSDFARKYKVKPTVNDFEYYVILITYIFVWLCFHQHLLHPLTQFHFLLLTSFVPLLFL